MTTTTANTFSEFTKKQQKLINQYGFRNMEHLAAYAQDEVGELRLSKLLSLSVNKLTGILKPFAVATDTIQFNSDMAKKHSLGLKQFTQPSNQQLNLASWESEIVLPKKFCLKKESTHFGIENQTQFPSCVAMACGLTAQVLFDNELQFSKYFYYWLLKYEQGNNEPGSCGYYALNVSKKWGHCPEFMLPFESWQESHTDFQSLPEPLLVKAAKKYQLNDGYYTNNAEISVTLIKSMLSGALGIKPRLVPIGVPLFTSFNNYYTWLTGEINEPLPGEKITGYHEMTVIGYCDDESYGGGGYLVVQNSWGESWAKESKEGSGICRIPYSYMQQHAEEVTIMLLKSENLPAILNPQHANEQASIAEDDSSNKAKYSRVYLGEIENKQQLYWYEKNVSNQNMLIVGSCGETKSNTVKHWINEQKKNKSTDHNIVFDMHGEYLGFCHMLNSNSYQANYIDITQVGLPFQVLKSINDQPIDLQAESLIADIKAAMPQLGNIQQATLREIIKRGFYEQWTNAELREQLERIDDENTKSQIYPFLLLLRSDGESLTQHLNNKLTVFDLSAFQDPRSRAAFVILTTSQLFHHQRQQFKKQGANNFGAIRLWFEEASTIKGAKEQLTTLFQQARKFKLISVYITQVLLDIPTFISRNCATQILFRSAVKDHAELKNKVLPNKLGEALIRIDINDNLVQIPLFDIDDKHIEQQIPPQKDVKFAKRCSKASIARKQATSINYLPAMFIDNKQTLFSKTIKLLKGDTKTSKVNWHLCFAFKAGKNTILMDAKTGTLVTQLNAYSTLVNWRSLLHHLPDVIDNDALQKLSKQQALTLSATGLFGFSDKGLSLAPQLRKPPKLSLGKLYKVAHNSSLAEQTTQLADSKLRDFRMVCSALWKITLPEEVMPIFVAE